MEMTLVHSLARLLAEENSVGVEDVRDGLRTDLVMFNGALKPENLNQNWGFLDILRPLLTDQGPKFRD